MPVEIRAQNHVSTKRRRRNKLPLVPPSSSRGSYLRCHTTTTATATPIKQPPASPELQLALQFDALNEPYANCTRFSSRYHLRCFELLRHVVHQSEENTADSKSSAIRPDGYLRKIQSARVRSQTAAYRKYEAKGEIVLTCCAPYIVDARLVGVHLLLLYLV